jgi:V8-like Glu-specific endopeptidase
LVLVPACVDADADPGDDGPRSGRQTQGPSEPTNDRAAPQALVEPIAEARSPIIGGARDHFRTYVVGVGDESGAFCSGTVISRRTVLTAGHCYSAKKGAKGGITRIWFGEEVDTSASRTGVATARVIRHPGFDAGTLGHDLTMVELAADAPTQAVPLLRDTLHNTAGWVGPAFTFVGYGDDGGYHYGVRRVVTFPIERVGPGKGGGSGPIDATQFYYRVPHKNTCSGDSGGPAFFPRGHVERLAGATSYGDGPCEVDGVDARTDEPAIVSFIQPTIDLFEGTDPCRADGVCHEECNVGGRLGDPDCAPRHCAADGICVLSCVDAPDPDCPVIDHCGADGVCDPTCAPVDPDCQPPRGD